MLALNGILLLPLCGVALPGPLLLSLKDSDDAHQHQGDGNKGSQQERDKQEESSVKLLALHTRLGLGDQMRLPQGGDHRLVEQENDEHVQTALDQVKGQEHRGQQLGNIRTGKIGHVQGGNQVIPKKHDRCQGQHPQDQARHGALLRVEPLVDKGGRAAERGGGQDVHDATDNAGIADGKHFHQRHHNGDDGGGQGAEDEAADADGGILQIQLQKAEYLRQEFADIHHHIGDGGQHGHGHPGPQGGSAGGKESLVGFDVGIGIGHKTTLLFCLKTPGRFDFSPGEQTTKERTNCARLCRTHLLPSRLYGWSRSFTGSAEAFRHPVADCTASGESHPALKTKYSVVFLRMMIAQFWRTCKSFFVDLLLMSILSANASCVSPFNFR